MAAALEPYRSVVDTLVIRGLPPDDEIASWLRIAAAVSSLG
ncbi:MAG: hypothetical protein ACRDG7_06905 [Candidatus Limnocylindria bacterium]